MTTYLFPTSFPMHNTHHPSPSPIILTTEVPPTNSPYRPQVLCANLRPRPYTFPTLSICTYGTFPLSITPTPIIVHDQTPQPTPILKPCTQLPPITSYPTCGCQFTLQGLAHHQHSYQTSNSFNPIPCDHLSTIPSPTPTLHAYA